MRDHPETPAGGRVARDHLDRLRKAALKEEILGLREHPPADPETVPVAAPRARFRREFFGGEGYQPINDQRTRLTYLDVAILGAIDGHRTVDEIATALARSPNAQDAGPDKVRDSVKRLVRGSLLRWSTIRRPDRVVRLEAYEEGDGSKDRLSSPINVLWEPTLHCNLFCGFCYNSSGPKAERGQRLTDAIDQFAESGAFQLTIIGGEPLMMPEFFDLVHRSEGLGISNEFVTNGWFVDEKMVARLLETQISQMVVSIDGLEETHDRVRGKQGSFKRAIRAVRLLSEAGFDVNVTACLQRTNVHEIDALVDCVVEAGACRVKLRPMVAEGRGRDAFDSDGLTIAEVERIQPTIRKKKEQYRGRASVVHRLAATEVGVCACDYNPERPGVIAQFKGTCGIGRLQCYVRVDGGVTPNSTLRDHVLDNIYERPFRQIWQDDSLWATVRPPNRAGDGVLNF